MTGDSSPMTGLVLPMGDVNNNYTLELTMEVSDEQTNTRSDTSLSVQVRTVQKLKNKHL